MEPISLSQSHKLQVEQNKISKKVVAVIYIRSVETKRHLEVYMYLKEILLHP